MPLKEIGKHVVAAIDLASGGTNVAVHAAQLASLNNATVHLVHVAESPPASLKRMLDRKELSAHMRRVKAEARARLDKLVNDLKEDGHRAAAYVAEGKPARELLACAEELGAGLIVAGAGVTEGTEWLFVGTTADRLVRNSKVPVLVVGTESVQPLKRILVPTDLDRADQGALRVASKIAMGEKGRVSVLHAYSQPSLLHGYSGDVAGLRRRAKSKATDDLTAWVDGCKLPEGARAPHKILKKCTDEVDPASAIVADATRLNMDLIVMALGGVTFLESFMIGAVAERVIRHLPCSLLTLPQAWARRR